MSSRGATGLPRPREVEAPETRPVAQRQPFVRPLARPSLEVVGKAVAGPPSRVGPGGEGLGVSTPVVAVVTALGPALVAAVASSVARNGIFLVGVVC